MNNDEPAPLGKEFSKIEPEWRNRADIPNTEGFKLRVLFEDNAECDAVVWKNPDTGFHSLKTLSGLWIPISVIQGFKGWKPRK